MFFIKSAILFSFLFFSKLIALKKIKTPLYSNHLLHFLLHNKNEAKKFTNGPFELKLSSLSQTDTKIGVVIAGSTGSIGKQTLEVLETICKTTHRVIGISANTNMHTLADQILRFNPKYVSVGNQRSIGELKNLINIPKETVILDGMVGLQTLCSVPEADMVMMSISGCNGILPTLSAAEHGKIICLANKETIISAGRLLFDIINKTGAIIRPVDSEHSALHQCVYKEPTCDTPFGLAGGPFININRMILTCSGGPCLNIGYFEMSNLKYKDIKHPIWNMGSKINVDSATLMNKGLEVIEAYELFGIPVDHIKTIIHKECIIHSLVEFNDKSTIAQLYLPDMKLPILQSLTSPGQTKCDAFLFRNDWPSLNLEEVQTLTFDIPDFKKFPCLKLAYQAGKQGGLYPNIMNAANEVANLAFRNDKIKILDISEVIKATMDAFNENDRPFSLESILESHKWAIEYAENIINKIKN